MTKRIGRFRKVRVELVKDKSVKFDFDNLETVETAAEFGRSLYFNDGENEVRMPAREIFAVCSLDVKGQPLAVEFISLGTTTSTLIGIKELFQCPLLCGASSIICYHQHLSGSPAPSLADNMMTNKIREAAKILDITFQDHIILGERSYYSYSEQGVIPWEEYCYENAG